MFKAKLRRIGNSQGIYIPKEVITNYKIGDILDVEVITKDKGTVITGDKVITTSKLDFCSKHPGSFKSTCGCK